MPNSNGFFSPAVENLLGRFARELKRLIFSESMEDKLLWVEISLFSIHGNVWGALTKNDDNFTHHTIGVSHIGHPVPVTGNPLYRDDADFPQEFSISQVLESLKADLQHSGVGEIYWHPDGNSDQLIAILGNTRATIDGFSKWWDVVKGNSKCGIPNGFVFFPVVVSLQEGEHLVGGIFFALSIGSIKDSIPNFYRIRTLLHLIIAQNFSKDLSRYARSATIGSIASFIRTTLEWSRINNAIGWLYGDAHDDTDSTQRNVLKLFFGFDDEYDLESYKGMFETELKARHPASLDLYGANSRRLLCKNMIEKVLKYFIGDDATIDWSKTNDTQIFSLPCWPGWMFLASLADFISKEGHSKELEMFQCQWDERVLSGVSIRLKSSDNPSLDDLHALVNGRGRGRGGQTTRNISDMLHVRLCRNEYNFENEYTGVQQTYAKHIIRGSEYPVITPLLVGKAGDCHIRFVWFGPDTCERV